MPSTSVDAPEIRIVGAGAFFQARIASAPVSVKALTTTPPMKGEVSPVVVRNRAGTRDR